ncbi:hypothetical protein [Gymnodinialimonas sp.]
MAEFTSKDVNDPIVDITASDPFFRGFDFAGTGMVQWHSFIDMDSGGLIVSKWSNSELNIAMEFRIDPESMANALLVRQFSNLDGQLNVDRHLFVSVKGHGGVSTGFGGGGGKNAKNKETWETVLQSMSDMIASDGKVDEKKFQKLAEKAAKLEGRESGEPKGLKRAWLWLIGRLEEDGCVDPDIFKQDGGMGRVMVRIDLPAEMASGPTTEEMMGQAMDPR